MKPVTVPYRTEVKNVENEIEKSLTLKWVMRQAALNPPQEKFIERIVDFLDENPENTITVRPEIYTEKEKEYILFFEAKKQFYLSANKMKSRDLSEKDSVRIEEISIKDSTFTYYLNRRAGRDIHTVQEKCRKIVKQEDVDRKLKQLGEVRKKFFLSFFKKEEVDKRVKFVAAESKVPFNGFSLFRINYNGKFPDRVLAAYQEINELDNDNPRNKFKDKRSRNRRLLDTK